MRGKVACMRGDRQHFGITPAYAGKSLCGHVKIDAHWDHPRLCGEKCNFALSFLSVLGSPPPMRGKAKIWATAFCVNGITPAYAGKRYGMTSNRSMAQDHPRLCGEKFYLLLCLWLSHGSPPPMRGKECSGYPDRGKNGITPAYAGKSCFSSLTIPLVQDHPRLCGEKL